MASHALSDLDWYLGRQDTSRQMEASSAKHTHRSSFENFLDHFVCFCDCVPAIYSIHVVYKVWGYSCLLLCVTSFCLSPHGPHTVCSECDERQWMIDAHRASTHLLCSSGGVWGMPSPFERCWGVGSCSWDATWKLRNSQTQLSPALHHLLTFFSNHIKRLWGEACLQGRAVVGLHWAFGCPETWSPSTRVFWHLWTQNLIQNKCHD